MLFLFPDLDDIRSQLISIQIKMLMPEIIDQYGGFAKLDLRINTPWQDYDGIVEEPIKEQNFMKITDKGIKSILTFPVQILLEEDIDDVPLWRMIREGTLKFKLDFDLSANADSVVFRPDMGIKKLILVYENEEKETESDAIKALFNLILMQKFGKKHPVDLTTALKYFMPCYGLSLPRITY